MDNSKKFLSRIWFVWLTTLTGIIFPVSFAVGQALEIKQASRLSTLDQNNNAIATLSAAMAKYPQDATLWYYLGIAQLKGNAPDKAQASFEKGIAVDEKEPLNYVGKGYVQLLNNKTAEAEGLFDRALSMTRSKNAMVLKAIAEAKLSGSKDANEVMPLLKKAIAIDERDFEALILIGDASLALNNGGQAVNHYEYSAKLDPQSGLPYYKIGMVYLRSKNLDVAQDAFSKAIDIDPEFTLAYKELGELYYLKKDGASAVKAYDNYLRLTENPEAGKMRYAFFLFMARDFAKANQVFKALAEKPDVNPVTLRYYAYSLFESGNLEESKLVFASYFKSVPTDQVEAGDYAYYAKLLLKQHEDSLALGSIQQSLALNENQPDLLQLQGETFFRLKKYEESISAYKKLFAIRPKPLSQDYYTIGRAYYFTKQYEKADSSFQQLIQLQPAMSIGYLWEARTKSNLDPESEGGLARPFYEKVIEQTVANPDKYKNDLIEAYSYMGYYHFIKQELPVSKSYWEKALMLNPDDLKAKEALKAIH